MKIVLNDKDILLTGENEPEISALLTLLRAREGDIYQVRKNKQSIEFVHLGNRATACNEAINVLFSDADDAVRLISNLAHTPFVLDGLTYASVEGFWQSLKYPASERADISMLHGKPAKKAGNRGYETYVFYEDQKIRVGSPAHWRLMRSACESKFAQHDPARQSLLATGIRPLYHKPRKDSDAIPGPIMAGIWMDIRGEWRKKLELRSAHLDRLR